jgi:tetratricopeptide (TPR) repeat protein
VTVPRTVITPTGAASIDELYEAAAGALLAGRFEQAAREFDRVFSLEPEGRLAPHALLQAGSAYDQLGNLEEAAARYEQLARRYPKHELAREALVRAVRLYAFLEQWEPAGAAADLLLTRYSDLGSFERIVAYSGKALALVSVGDLVNASAQIEKGRSVIETHRLDAAGRVSRDLAQLYFALGELRRMRAERIRFTPVPPNFAAVLEERCQLLLDAQSAYSDTMRAYDAHWSAMAGYRVGELYQRLHEDLMAVPPPKSADTEKRRQLFEGAMRLRYSILLTKALTMMEHTLNMAKRTGERSQWVSKAEEAREKIERTVRAENAALDRLPYSRAELQAALDDLARTKQSGTAAPGEQTRAK